MTHVVITADDFGAHPEVNAAVERAHTQGVLTAASLMVAGEAAEEAIRIARRLPHLRVGLHLVVADGWASLPAHEVPQLADAQGFMDARLLRRSVRLLRPRAARQLEAEISAQFQAFRRTGLPLDHVNVHKHLHLHPTILRTLIRVALRHGAPPVRVPSEPLWMPSSTGRLAPLLAGGFLLPWVRLARGLIRRAGLPCNDALFGIAHSGGVDEAVLLRVLARLPAGVCEIYSHPATGVAPVAANMHGYRPREELLALLSPRVRRALEACGASRGGYRDAVPAP